MNLCCSLYPPVLAAPDRFGTESCLTLDVCLGPKVRQVRAR